MDANRSPSNEEEKPQVVTPRQARGGLINYRVIAVLIGSLILAAVVMFVFLKIDWRL